MSTVTINQTATYTLATTPIDFSTLTTIVVTSGYAVYDDANANWNVTNQGTLSGGVRLVSSNTFTNDFTGVLNDAHGLSIDYAGTITNAGLITGSGTHDFEVWIGGGGPGGLPSGGGIASEGDVLDAHNSITIFGVAPTALSAEGFSFA